MLSLKETQNKEQIIVIVVALHTDFVKKMLI